MMMGGALEAGLTTSRYSLGDVVIKFLKGFQWSHDDIICSTKLKMKIKNADGEEWSW